MFSVLQRLVIPTAHLHRRLLPAIGNFSVIARNVGHVQKQEEKKRERLKTLRNAVVEFYTKKKKAKIDRDELRAFLIDHGLNQSNFEFLLLSAFEQTEGERIDRSVFESIAELVANSPIVRGNKIAATRFCTFLANFPDYLTPVQCQFIKDIAEEMAKEVTRVSAIRRDILQSLAMSSAENCRHAFELFHRLVDEDSGDDFKLKVEVLNILVENSIRFGLVDQLETLVRDRSEYLDMDMNKLDTVVDLLASTEVCSLSKKRLVGYFDLLSRLYSPLTITTMNQVLDLLGNRLKYKKIEEDVAISREGVCSCCGTKLAGLSRIEYDQLRAEFRSIIFDRNEEYMMANLTEFEIQLMEFDSLIKDDPNAPRPKFDLVADGLNIGYNRSSSLVPDSRGLRTFAKVYKVKDIDTQLIRILGSDEVLQSFRKILLMGRAHMKQWQQLERLLRRNRDQIVAKFLLNRTRDDNYLLLAAIQHPETRIFSSDLFRDHREKFRNWFHSSEGDAHRPNLHRHFIRWLRSRQIKFNSNGALQLPNRFDASIQFHEGVVHVPIVTQVDKLHQEDHRIQWICARP